MNTYLIRAVAYEGPLHGDAVAANDGVYDTRSSRAKEIGLALVPAAPTPNAMPNETSNDDDDYYLGGYAGI